MLFTGNEKLHLGNKDYPYTMLQFWQTSLSEILLNMTRGSFAEFLVKCALDEGGLKTLRQSKTGIEPYDIEGPMILSPEGERASRIEVKSAASIQIDTPDEKEPLSLKDTQLKFSIKPAIDWEHAEKGAHRNNDLYVFCHYKAARKKDDMLDLTFWDFYVYPTYKIEDDKSLSKQKSFSVYRLKKLGVQPQTFETLYQEVMRTLKDISDHYAESSHT